MSFVYVYDYVDEDRKFVIIFLGKPLLSKGACLALDLLVIQLCKCR